MRDRLHQAREEWETRRRRVRRQAAILGGLTVGVLVSYALLTSAGWRDVVLAALFGGIGWALLGSAFQALVERVRREGVLPPPVRSHRLGISFVLGFLVLVGFYGILQIPGIVAPIVLGALTWMSGQELLQLREVSRPRAFVSIGDDAHVLPVLPGTHLLTALEEAGYRLLTQCGRKGQCATCRVRVRAGARTWTSKEQGAALTPRQKGQGWVLSCQVTVDRDMEIDLFKPLVLRWPSFPARRLSEAARSLRRALPGFHCEVCGYRLCEEYAQAIAEGREPITRCLPGGEPVLRRLEEIAQREKIVLRKAEKTEPERRGEG